MVKAIRFWGTAAKLIAAKPVEKATSGGRRAPELQPTPLGRRLFDNDGWDPYMEDPGTLWLLHWLLLAPPSQLPVWWLAFNDFPAIEFAADDLQAFVTLRIESSVTWSAPSPSSIKKDVTAFFRTYAPAERSARTKIDDILDCPLRELNLVGRSGVTGRYRFALGHKPTLPPALLAYAALDYVARAEIGGGSITIGRLVHDPGSPGKAFKISEAEYAAALEPAVANIEELAVVTTTGATQLSWTAEPSAIATEILNGHYGAQTLAAGREPR